TAGEVRERHGVDVRTIAADLADPGIGKIADDATKDIDVGLLVYNATIAPQGRFIDVPLEDQLASVAVNCTTPVILCNLFAPRMVGRSRGGAVRQDRRPSRLLGGPRRRVGHPSLTRAAARPSGRNVAGRPGDADPAQLPSGEMRRS